MRLEERQLALDGIAPRACAWCGDPLPPASAPDRKTCSQPCRQALHRFRVAPAGAPAAAPMRLGYLDPPYPGLARKYYSDDPRCAEVDHHELIAGACRDFPDGWALSTSAAALREVWALCPPETSLRIWVRGARRGGDETAAARHMPNAWEPLLVWRGRPLAPDVRDVTDVLIWGGRQHSHPGALVGMKSAAFAEWMFRQLGATTGDTLVDVFPGSGAIARAWRMFNRAAAPRGLPSRAAEAAARIPVAEDLRDSEG